MENINVPTRDEVSTTNQEIFDTLQSKLGFVPNLYATYAHSDNALSNYLTLQNAKTSLKAKEKEVVNLTVSQVNNCEYCLAAHTAISKLNNFSDDQILEIRTGTASFDSKLNSLAKLSKAIAENRGVINQDLVEDFFNAGYTKENLIDVIVQVGDKTVSNYLHNITKVPVDFPAAPALESTAV